MMFQGAFTTRVLSRAGRCTAPRSARRPRSRAKRPGQRGGAQGDVRARAPVRLPAMDLLLTHGYFLHEDPKELQIMKPYAPLGILYLSSHLRARGFRRGDLRFHFRFARGAVPDSGDGAAGRSRHRRKSDDSRATRWRSCERAAAVRAGRWSWAARSRPIMRDEYLAAGAHVVVAGEGELTLEELLPRRCARRSGSGHLLSGSRRQP